MYRRLVVLTLAMLLVSSTAMADHSATHVYRCWRVTGGMKCPDWKPIRLIVNGQKLPLDQPAFIENGRILVPARMIAEAMPNGHITFDERTGEVMVRELGVGISAWRYVRMNPRDESRVVEVGTMYGESFHYELDTYPRLINGRTYLPARIIPEAFNCFSTYDASGNERVYWIDCSKPANLHEDVTRVLEHNQPTLNNDGFFVLPPGPLKMYPSTHRVVRTKVELSNTAISAVDQLNPNRIHLRYDKTNNRVLLLDETSLETIIGSVYSDYLVMVMDKEKFILLKQQLEVSQHTEATVASFATALITIWIPGLGEVNAGRAFLTAAGMFGGVEYVEWREINRISTCMELAESRGEKITVGYRFPQGFQCIPVALEGPVHWSDFETLGVK